MREKKIRSKTESCTFLLGRPLSFGRMCLLYYIVVLLTRNKFVSFEKRKEKKYEEVKERKGIEYKPCTILDTYNDCDAALKSELDCIGEKVGKNLICSDAVSKDF